MTFKLESIKTEIVNKEQSITGEYVFKENNKLNDDRTFCLTYDPCEKHSPACGCHDDSPVVKSCNKDCDIYDTTGN